MYNGIPSFIIDRSMLELAGSLLRTSKLPAASPSLTLLSRARFFFSAFFLFLAVFAIIVELILSKKKYLRKVHLKFQEVACQIAHL